MRSESQAEKEYRQVEGMSSLFEHYASSISWWELVKNQLSWLVKLYRDRILIYSSYDICRPFIRTNSEDNEHLSNSTKGSCIYIL